MSKRGGAASAGAEQQRAGGVRNEHRGGDVINQRSDARQLAAKLQPLVGAGARRQLTHTPADVRQGAVQCGELCECGGRVLGRQWLAAAQHRR